MTNVVSAVVAMAVVSAFAAEFPYGTELTVRHERASAIVSSLENPVVIPAVNGGMPMTDSVVTLSAAVVNFCVFEGEDWAEGVAAVGNVQAALAMKLVDGSCAWMGYTGGEWREFAADGADAEDGAWEVKIDADYTAEPMRIRYSVRRPGASDYVALLNGGSAWVPTGSTTAVQKLNQVLLYGSGETGLVQAKSGCRMATVGTLTVADDVGTRCDKLVIDVMAAGSWGYTDAKVTLKDETGVVVCEAYADLTDGRAEVDLSDSVRKGETYAYEVELTGAYRGTTFDPVRREREVTVALKADWFAFVGGSFVNAAAGTGLTVADDVLSAAAVSPRGLVEPTAAAPKGTTAVTVLSTMTVAGAVQESALPGLDASRAQGALTVVRFASDGERAWACRRADGSWARLSGAGVSAANGTYDVRMDLDYRDGKRVVSYSVKVADGWVRLADVNEATSFDLPADVAVMRKASLLGGTVSSLAASCLSVPAGGPVFIFY